MLFVVRNTLETSIFLWCASTKTLFSDLIPIGRGIYGFAPSGLTLTHSAFVLLIRCFALVSGTPLGLHEALAHENARVDDAALEPLRARLGPGVGRPDVLAHLLDDGEQLDDRYSSCLL